LASVLTTLFLNWEIKRVFLAIALPTLWPTNYSIFSSFDEVGNASIIASTYNRNVPHYIEEAISTQTFVFLNLTAGFPSWGTGWRNVEPGIISGYLYGKKVVIIGIESFENKEIVNLAKKIYEEING